MSKKHPKASMITLSDALAFVGVDIHNARQKLESARKDARAWIKSTKAPESLKHFVDRFIQAGTDIDIPLRDLAILVGAVIYVVSPIDLIPDVIPVIGWTDDAAVASLALKTVGEHWDRHDQAA